MIPKGSGKTEAEIFFISKIKDGTLSITQEGVIFNNKTKNYIGATGSGRYPKISMKNLKDGKIYNIQIHRLVWIVFIGDIEEGLVINHKDFNKENRALDNLEIVTLKENTKHFVDSERFIPLPGESNGNSKLLDYDVKIMREEYKYGIHTIEYYAKKYGVHRATIASAISGQRYYNA